MNKLLLTISAIAILAACTPEPEPVELPDAPQIIVPGLKAADGTIAENPNSITLSNYSQEQQKIDREFYAQQLANIRAQRQEVTTAEVPQMSSTNVAAYARASQNAVGQSVFQRSGKKGSCSYSSADAAQRAFLEAGGPASDSLGLDPDGDGFACKFDPAPYRAL